jgi:hypothetical protein
MYVKMFIQVISLPLEWSAVVKWAEQMLCGWEVSVDRWPKDQVSWWGFFLENNGRIVAWIRPQLVLTALLLKGAVRDLTLCVLGL